ncbi:hypothetical protein [Streptomyces aquilus]|uniref:hypothetical protein n=1 Tax=Streptomyces aquilus TaxID=2548456 RepID=UPI00368508B3
MTDEMPPEQGGVFIELTRLAKVGVKSPQVLEQCSSLERLFLALVGGNGCLSYGSRHVVLEKLLSRVADDARVLSLRAMAENPFIKQSEEHIFKVAAAAELLGTINEAAFKVKNEKWKRPDAGWTWEKELRNKENKPPRRQRQLRAGVWIEQSRSSIERKEKQLIAAFESALRTYVASHREELKVFVADHLESAAGNAASPGGPIVRESGQLLAVIDEKSPSGSDDRDAPCTTPERPPQSNSRTYSNAPGELSDRRESVGDGETGRQQVWDSRIRIWRQFRAIFGGRKAVAVFTAGVLLALSIVIIPWPVGNGQSSVSDKGSEVPASGKQSSTGIPMLDGQPCLAGMQPDGDEPEVLDFQLPSGATSTPCPKSILFPITESTRKRSQVSQYAIQSGANIFHATLHVSSPFGASVEFKASTDNSSETHTLSAGEEKEVSIPVAGAQTVKLTTTIRDVGGEAVGYAVWGNAQFLP